MASVAERFTVLFPDGYDAQREYETPFRGYLNDVIVQLENGARFSLFFIDPIRLQQELDRQIQAGQPYFAEPNTIVVPEVTTEMIRKTVEGLVQEGYFEALSNPNVQR